MSAHGKSLHCALALSIAGLDTHVKCLPLENVCVHLRSPVSSELGQLL